jgi:nucleotide-binding universal stress UspA family protein
MKHKVLVPFEIPDAEPLSPRLVRALATVDVVVLGHYALPEQTPPDVAREQFIDDAERELDELAGPLVEAGATVTTRVVFGRDRVRTIDRVAIEEGCDAELDPAPVESVGRILVPLVDAENLDRLAEFVAALVDEAGTEVTLLHVVEEGDSIEDGEAMLTDAREGLVERGFDPADVDVSVVAAADPEAEILRAAEGHDAVVMDETEPSVPERIFGTLPDRIAEGTGDPVIVVRRNV